jgi:hypothetical protein
MALVSPLHTKKSINLTHLDLVIVTKLNEEYKLQFTFTILFPPFSSSSISVITKYSPYQFVLKYSLSSFQISMTIFELYCSKHSIKRQGLKGKEKMSAPFIRDVPNKKIWSHVDLTDRSVAYLFRQ